MRNGVDTFLDYPRLSQKETLLPNENPFQEASVSYGFLSRDPIVYHVYDGFW